MPSLSLASAWWRQHGLQERVRLFRASRQPTPPHRALPPNINNNGCSRTQYCRQAATTTAQSSLSSSSESRTTSTPTDTLASPPVLLMSACLLGFPVTYRGADVRLPATLRPTPLLFLTEVLWRELGLVCCVPVCPEMEWLGLSAPRPPLRLVRDETECKKAGATNAQENERCRVVDAVSPDRVFLSYHPFTDELPSAVVAALGAPLHAIDGVVLKARSPSCGVHDARLYSREAATARAASCAACSNSRLPSARPSQRPTAASASTSYAHVDGFFAMLLRNSLCSSCGEKRGGHAHGAPISLPVITSDRLLSRFYAADDATSPSSSSSGLPLNGGCGANGEVGLAHTSLDAFVESALRHREGRLARRHT
ncbi:putative mitochondrial hypothetical protein [Leptomonas pyrrhocoris]|uniref:Uncharacterized protein n=1 Tax=Leptomonas pyrrhocoris TaxID=157538 RepID=A0A0N0DUK9_LEPPY|nr:putative mitochondrial hypothetical protein [Leptomonas pyrrhocoris]KPA79088.1 putative mitochondrial hypothetical protein [Leptomonas pyrrhocoris]|eukprot:XP_015657527.1 putative mitochondrial hypothetical protein [Leptomonas pyrrhocoris]